MLRYRSAPLQGAELQRCNARNNGKSHINWEEVESAIAQVGLRGCLCYEVTDRGGKGQRDITLEENERYLQKLLDAPRSGMHQFRGMVGAHASFTLEERTLQLLEGICSRMGVGLHIHLAEGTTDREVSQDRGWKEPLARLPTTAW